MNLECIICVLGTLSWLLPLTHAGNILLLPFPWKSHVSEISGVGKTLVSNGHQVSIMLPPTFPGIEKVRRDSPFTVLEYRISQKDLYQQPQEEVDDMIESLMSLTPIEDLRWNVEGFWQFCHNPLSDGEFLATLRAQKFDLAVVDAFPCSRCNFVLAYRLDIPYVSLTTTYEPWLLRIPALPSFVPFPLAQYFTDRMTFRERLINFFTLIDWSYDTRIPYLSNSFVRPFIPDRPFVSLDDLARRSKIWLFDTDVLLDYPRPMMPNEVNIGGLSTKPAGPLPDDLSAFIDESDEGFILLSFGSQDVLTEEKLVRFLEAFQEVPQQIILRTTMDRQSLKVAVPTNVRLMSWIPQNDLLGHPKCKLFITHCGANGQFEALYHGIPMLGFPIFADQPYNARRVEHHGFGLYMNIVNFSANSLTLTIKELITNPSYKRNIAKASAIFRGRPFNPRERAAFWVEEVLNNNVDHLRSSAFDIQWYEYLMLDILLVIILIVGAGISLVCGFLYCCCRIKGHEKSKKLD